MSSAESQAVDLLVERYFAALLAGEKTSVDTFCRAHPEGGEALRQRLQEFESSGGGAPEFASDATEAATLADRVVGDFRIVREIGRGGMGVVYEAEQLSLHRRVALKVLPAHLTLQHSVIERFQREASTAARLKHPGIVEIHAVGSLGDTHFFAMELVEGEPLDRWLERVKAGQIEGAKGKNLLAAICEIVVQIADALEHAHQAGVIHRDVKPSNVLVRRDGSAVLTDFGLARAEGLPSITVTGEFAGTPYYVSPEQAMARRMKVDHRTDVFSLGVTLYELLTLRKPFEGKTSQEVLGKILTKEPPPPRRVNPHIARDLETICLHAIEKDPDRRYRSAAAMAADLRAFLEYRPIAAQPVAAWTRASRWMQRNPALAGLASLLLVGVPLLAGLAGYVIAKQPDIERGRQQVLRDRVEKELEEGYFELGEGSAEKAQAAFARALELDRSSVEAVAGIALAHLRQGDHAVALTWLDQRADLEAAEPALGWPRAAALEKAGRAWEATALTTKLGEPQSALAAFFAASVALRKGQAGDKASFARALELAERAVVRAPHLRALYHFEWALAAGAAGNALAGRRSAASLQVLWPQSHSAWVFSGVALHLSKADIPAAIQSYRRALSLRPGESSVYSNLGGALMESGDLAAAVIELRRAVDLSPGDADARMNLGVALAKAGNIPEGVAELRRSIELDPEHEAAHANLGVFLLELGSIPQSIASSRWAVELAPKSAHARHSLAEGLRASGDLFGAIAEYRSAVELDPLEAQFHDSLARALMECRDLSGAISSWRRALELEPKGAGSHLNLGLALQETGDLPGALVQFRRAIELDGGLADAHEALALALRESGDLSAAVVSIRRAAEANPMAASVQLNMGAILQLLGDLTGAIAAYRRAIELDPESATARGNLGKALHASGDLPSALPEFQRATVLAPQDASTHFDLGVALSASGDSVGAIAAHRRAVELDPELARAHANLGLALKAAGDLTGSVAALRRAIELGSKSTDVHVNAVEALMMSSDFSGARAVLENLVQCYENHAFAWSALAWFLVAPDGAVEQLDSVAGLAAARKAVELSRGTDPSILDTFAHALLLSGDVAAAIETEVKALALTKQSVSPDGALIQSLEEALGRFRAAASAASKPASAPAR